MRYQTFELEAPSTVANGAGQLAGELLNASVMFAVTGGAYQVQISPDGTSWIDYGSAINASGVVELPFAVHSVRVATTANGSAVALLCGQTPN